MWRAGATFRPDMLDGMESITPPSNGAGAPILDDMLRRSVEMDLAALDILSPETYELCDDATNVVASLNACEVAMEHARAIRTLISEGFDTTAASVLRLEFEAVVRAMWLLWAASEEELAKISAPLSAESEAAAKNLPMVSKMIELLKDAGPPGAYEMVAGFKATMLSSLNSFVHAGIHPIQRHSEGYPESLMAQVLQNSNALFLMATMLLANLTGDEAISGPMSKIQRGFADCLPELLGPTAAQ